MYEYFIFLFKYLEKYHFKKFNTCSKIKEKPKPKKNKIESAKNQADPNPNTMSILLNLEG
jgi:hypothetical protein